MAIEIVPSFSLFNNNKKVPKKTSNSNSSLPSCNSAAESTIDYDDDTIGDEGPSFPVSSSLSDMWDESLASKGKKNYSAEKKKNEFGPLERFWKFIDWAAYFYYNERKSSFTDLAVIAAINISTFLSIVTLPLPS